MLMFENEWKPLSNISPINKYFALRARRKGKQGFMSNDLIEISLPSGRNASSKKPSKESYDIFCNLTLIGIFQSYQTQRRNKLAAGMILSLLPDHIYKLLESARSHSGLPSKQLIGCIINWINHCEIGKYFGENRGSVLKYLALDWLASMFKIDHKVVITKVTSESKIEFRIYFMFSEFKVNLAKNGCISLFELENNGSFDIGFVISESTFFYGLSTIKGKKCMSIMKQVLSKIEIESRDFSALKDTKEDEIEVPTSRKQLKNHPIFILESDLKKYEVLHPKDVAGFFENEPVYFRKNVQKIRSKEAWLTQFGRVIKVRCNIQL